MIEDMETKLAAAASAVTQAREALRASLGNIGMTRRYHGHDPQTELLAMIESYVAAQARLEMLRILSSEDFFHAVTTSAGAVKS